MLSVSPATVHRAMQLLVDRQLLVRQHGRGSFIGHGVQQSAPEVMQTILILTPQDRDAAMNVYLDAVIVHGVRSTFKGISIQFSSVPAHGSLHYVRELMQNAQRGGQLLGVIARSCSRDVYRHLSELGHPLVILGSLCADQQHLPSVDLNYHHIGRPLTRRLVLAGHRHLALLIAGEGTPGDHAFYSGVSDVLAEANLPHNAMTVRIFPREYDAFRAQVHELLERTDRPTGIICGLERFVPVVVDAASRIGLSIPRDLEIVFHSQSIHSAESLPYAHTQPKRSFYEIAKLLADVLKRQAEGSRPNNARVVIDVQLRVPSTVEINVAKSKSIWQN